MQPEAMTRPIRSDLPKVPEMTGVTPQDFQGEIYPRARPVVMRGAASEWPIVRAARGGDAATYLQDMATDIDVAVLSAGEGIGGRFFYSDDMRGFNFTRGKAALRQVLKGFAIGAEEGARYIESAPADTLFEGFRAANALPHAPASIEPLIWIGNGVTVPIHYDLSQNLAVVAAGRRRFTLFPPQQVGNLYMGPMEHTPSGTPVSMVRTHAIDDDRFPRFREAEAHAMVADLEPGDAIFVPYMWWHQVESSGPLGVLVNYWWNEYDVLGSPLDAMMHAMLTIRDMPPPMRSAWQAMFAHLVFKKGSAAMDHLPAPLRGGLGPHTPQQRGAMWGALHRTIGARLAKLGK